MKWTDLCNICSGCKEAIKIINKCVNAVNDNLPDDQELIDVIDDISEVTEDAIITLTNKISETDMLSQHEFETCRTN